jgi:quinol monooxygenase YgiN
LPTAADPADRSRELEELSVEVLLFARLHARPGMRSEVLQAILDVQGPTRAEPGCLGYGAFQSVRDPDEFYIHSRRQDPDAFDRHAGLEHTVRFVEVVEPLLDRPLKVSLCEPLP